MFAIAKQRRTNKIWINMHNLSYLSLNMNQNLILKRSTDRIQFAAMRKYISDNLNAIPWMFFLLAIRYHDSPPCLLSVLLKDCTRKMIPVKKKGVSIKHKCVLLMFIKAKVLYKHFMWYTCGWQRIEINFLYHLLVSKHWNSHLQTLPKMYSLSAYLL